MLDLVPRLPPVRAGGAVVDLGCWPGSWLQVLGERVGSTGRIVGVDLTAVDPLPEPVVLLQLDFTEPGAPERIADALGRPADLLVCDAAPNLTGIRDVDRAALEEIWDAALQIAERVCSERAGVLIKGFPGPPADVFRKQLRARFANVSEVRPEARRGSSQEFYWVATPVRRSRRRRRA